VTESRRVIDDGMAGKRTRLSLHDGDESSTYSARGVAPTPI